MYTLYIAIRYENSAGEPDYESLIGIPVPTKNISDIKTAMFLMDVTIYRISRGMETVYESVRLLEIMQRRVERKSG